MCAEMVPFIALSRRLHHSHATTLRHAVQSFLLGLLLGLCHVLHPLSSLHSLSRSPLSCRTISLVSLVSLGLHHAAYHHSLSSLRSGSLSYFFSRTESYFLLFCQFACGSNEYSTLFSSSPSSCFSACWHSALEELRC